MKHYTYDDILALPEGVRAELMDGQIYYMASPTLTHQRILGNLYVDIVTYIRKNKGTCEAFPAPCAVFLYADHSTYLEPDLIVVCDRDKLKPDGCYGAPDWVVEILSPSSRYLDCSKKLFKYQTAGVNEYWIVDPMNEMVRVYRFHTEDEEKTYEEYNFTDEIPNDVCKDLKLCISRFQSETE